MIFNQIETISELKLIKKAHMSRLMLWASDVPVKNCLELNPGMRATCAELRLRLSFHSLRKSFQVFRGNFVSFPIQM